MNFKNMDDENFAKLIEQMKKGKRGAVFYFGANFPEKQVKVWGRPLTFDFAFLQLQCGDSTLLLAKKEDACVCIAKGEFEKFKQDEFVVVITEGKKSKRMFLLNLTRHEYTMFRDRQDVSEDLDFVIYCRRASKSLFGNIINIGVPVPVICLSFSEEKALCAHLFQLAAREIVKSQIANELTPVKKFLETTTMFSRDLKEA